MRPEHFEVSKASAATISGTVEYTEVLGSDSFLYVATPHGLITVREEGRTGFTPGDAIHMSPVAQMTHRFGEDGKRLA